MFKVVKNKSIINVFHYESFNILLCLSNGVNANQELVLKTTPVQGSVLQVRIPMDQDLTENHVSYFPQLLALALDKTISTDGPYNISYLNEKYTTNVDRALGFHKANSGR